MAQVSIDQLPRLEAPDSADQIPIRDESQNVLKFVTVQDLANAASRLGALVLDVFHGDKSFTGSITVRGTTTMQDDLILNANFQMGSGRTIPSSVLPEIPKTRGGVPSGGSTHHVLRKNSNSNFDYDWAVNPYPSNASTSTVGISRLASGSEVRGRANTSAVVTPSGLSTFAKFERLTTTVPLQGDFKNSVSHNLNSPPLGAFARLICNAADAGYQQNDEVLIVSNNHSGRLVVAITRATSTNFDLMVSSDGNISIPHRSNGSLTSIVESRWSVAVTIYA